MSGKEKISTLLKGLDEMMNGITAPSVIGVVGPPGSGKTLIPLQFLNACLAAGKSCLYLSSMHSKDELLKNSVHPATISEKKAEVEKDSSAVLITDESAVSSILRTQELRYTASIM
jgi:KaiC/GvpD/RAD55 family RecA-like ATPase